MALIFFVAKQHTFLKEKREKESHQILRRIFKKASFFKKILPLAGGDFFENP
jgi:hypothetical protein